MAPAARKATTNTTIKEDKAGNEDKEDKEGACLGQLGLRRTQTQQRRLEEGFVTSRIM